MKSRVRFRTIQIVARRVFLRRQNVKFDLITVAGIDGYAIYNMEEKKRGGHIRMMITNGVLDIHEPKEKKGTTQNKTSNCVCCAFKKKLGSR